MKELIPEILEDAYKAPGKEFKLILTQAAADFVVKHGIYTVDQIAINEYIEDIDSDKLVSWEDLCRV